VFFDVLYLDDHDVPRAGRCANASDYSATAVRFSGPLRFTAHRNTTGEEGVPQGLRAW